MIARKSPRLRTGVFAFVACLTADVYTLDNGRRPTIVRDMSNDIDRITGKSFATTPAAMLIVGERYALTFDGDVRTVARVSDIQVGGTVLVRFEDMAPHKAIRLPLNRPLYRR